jgi:hypothetical protein
MGALGAVPLPAHLCLLLEHSSLLPIRCLPYHSLKWLQVRAWAGSSSHARQSVKDPRFLPSSILSPFPTISRCNTTHSASIYNLNLLLEANTDSLPYRYLSSLFGHHTSSITNVKQSIPDMTLEPKTVMTTVAQMASLKTGVTVSIRVGPPATTTSSSKVPLRNS